MRHVDERLFRRRQKCFLHRCKEVEITGCELYHGSPLEGMESIRRAKGLRPQSGHGMLPGDWLCVSPNDNMLRFFGEEDRITGLRFDVEEPLTVLHLDYDLFERKPTALAVG